AGAAPIGVGQVVAGAVAGAKSRPCKDGMTVPAGLLDAGVVERMQQARRGQTAFQRFHKKTVRGRAAWLSGSLGGEQVHQPEEGVHWHSFRGDVQGDLSGAHDFRDPYGRTAGRSITAWSANPGNRQGLLLNGSKETMGRIVGQAGKPDLRLLLRT